jgi:NAD(P)-dependent dehydrogenase (short-subunit alcohol dehydrogenase family)
MVVVDLHLAGKRALVTGGSRGIGKAAAAALFAEGADVAIAARDQARLGQAAADISAGTGRTRSKWTPATRSRSAAWRAGRPDCSAASTSW